MSEFEKQKQEIKGMLIEGISRIKNEFDNHLSFGTFDMEEIDTARHDLCDALDEFNKLQPPAPPKCSSCRHAEFAHQFCLNTRAGVMHGEFVDDEFGCIQHSDYDKEGEV